MRIHKGVLFAAAMVACLLTWSCFDSPNSPDGSSPNTANAYLKDLTISDGTLSPGFDSTVTSYSATTDDETVNFAPTTSDPSATVKVNDSTVSQGSTSHEIPLSVGSNTITITVTAQDGSTTETYAVAVTRTGSRQSKLESLTLSTGTLSPAFDSAHYIYNLLTSTETIVLAPTACDTNATIKINGTVVASGGTSDSIPLSYGADSIIIVVKAQDTTAASTYKIFATRYPRIAGTWSITQTYSASAGSYSGTTQNDTWILTQDSTHIDTRFGLRQHYTFNGGTLTGDSISLPFDYFPGSNINEGICFFGKVNATADTVVGNICVGSDSSSTLLMVKTADTALVNYGTIPTASGSFTLDGDAADWSSVSAIITDDTSDLLQTGPAGVDLVSLKLALNSAKDSLFALITFKDSVDTLPSGMHIDMLEYDFANNSAGETMRMGIYHNGGTWWTMNYHAGGLLHRVVGYSNITSKTSLEIGVPVSKYGVDGGPSIDLTKDHVLRCNIEETNGNPFDVSEFQGLVRFAN